MALYRYNALDANGKSVKGTVESGTPAEARASLRKSGLLTTTIEPAILTERKAVGGSEEANVEPSVAFSGLGGKKLDLLVGFSRHLSLLLKAGIPLSQSLAIMAEQVENPGFKHVIEDSSVRVKEGASLDQALGAHPKYFPEMYICIARAGAASGNIGSLLNQISLYYARQKRLRDKVISALTYPALMCCIGLLVLVFLLAFVVPKVTGVLLEQKRVLPWPTEILLGTSDFIQGYWWLLIAFALAGGWVLSGILRRPSGRRAYDRMVLWVPIIGELFRKQAVARWADTMSNLLTSGIPVAQSLAIVRSALGNIILADEVSRLEQAIINGEDLSEALEKSRCFPKSIAFIVGVGEESGELPRVLRDVADSFNDEVEVVSSRLTDLVNPILIVVLGGLVGFIVAAILLPITDFSQIQ